MDLFIEEQELTKSSDIKESMYPWTWSGQVTTADYSPSSRGSSSPSSSPSSAFKLRRGRPKSDAITSLILKGSLSASSIKCRICCRVFPRLKSLNAHMRTHTGERPYRCDHPKCEKSFAQSGQLKTHMRLHTGEKPFICSIPDCSSRFTHANRRCIFHPLAPLERDMDNDSKYKTNIENKSEIELLGKKLKNDDLSLPLRKSIKIQNNIDDCKKNAFLDSKHNIFVNTVEESVEYSVALALLELASRKY